jgi:hypothetical protein
LLALSRTSWYWAMRYSPRLRRRPRRRELHSHHDVRPHATPRSFAPCLPLARPHVSTVAYSSLRCTQPWTLSPLFVHDRVSHRQKTYTAFWPRGGIVAGVESHRFKREYNAIPVFSEDPFTIPIRGNALDRVVIGLSMRIPQAPRLPQWILSPVFF